MFHPRAYFFVSMLTARWTAHLTAVYLPWAFAASSGIGVRPIPLTGSIRAVCHLRLHAHELSLPCADHTNAIAFAVNASYNNQGGGHRKLLPLLGLTLIVQKTQRHLLHACITALPWQYNTQLFGYNELWIAQCFGVTL